MLNNMFRYIFIPAMALVLSMLILGYVQKTSFGKWLSGEGAEQEVKIGGYFELTNHKGELVKATDFRDNYMLVYFGFTSCAHICPVDIATISDVMEKLTPPETEILWPLFITIDPERDSPAKMADYLSSFNPKIQGLTGDKEAISNVLKNYKVYANKQKGEDAENYDMDHSGYMYLMGKDGRYLTHFRHGQSSDEIVKGIRKHINS
ncbi:SCO family protein [Rickettsiales bacterium]|nr:SCO family protein [Rickettsiales bacterium]